MKLKPVVYTFIALLVTPLVLAALLSSASASVSYAQGNPRGNVASGDKVDVLVGFTQTPGADEEALVRGFGGEIKRSFTLVPAMAVSLPEASVAGLSRNPNVTVIEPDGMFYAINYQTELDNTWGVKRIGAGEVHVHEGGNLGAGIKVAVIDSGIDDSHPDLNTVGGYDFVNNDDDPMDDNGHGTHVAGTVAALRNGTGVVGVAPEADLYAYKVLNASGGGSYSNVIAALERAVNDKVNITNNSYGSSGDPGSLVKAAFDNSAAAGILHVAAAGNSGNPPGSGDNVGYPARWDSVVAVAATGTNDKRASWSSTGPAVEISAPGVNIRSTLMGGGYGNMSGTSMASPHVAGVAALVMASGITNAGDVRAVMNSTAIDLGNPNHYGHGLVDAFSAVLGGVEGEDPADPVDPVDPIDGTMTVSSIEL
jgi:subtilisin